ncbi:DUF4177 domain-containing protein [Shouchella clausii]|uniref:DUF4177 domain-containing protein n=1 Tax=Shouchella clausii TaxID=79880 RepID=UPI0026F454FA|nr:DUF4177 domain-containing protein [Shouchella clausii]MDO7281747.1 DUF4177 domain-containing protein [Shouchella clausii]MDO7301842.1 DUF4177 domain-containing protein [Shouchella clausii]
MKWQYKTYSWNSAYLLGKYEELEKDLNKLGEEGWEVINSVPIQFRGDDGVTEQTDEVVYLLKREID